MIVPATGSWTPPSAIQSLSFDCYYLPAKESNMELCRPCSCAVVCFTKTVCTYRVKDNRRSFCVFRQRVFLEQVENCQQTKMLLDTQALNFILSVYETKESSPYRFICSLRASAFCLLWGHSDFVAPWNTEQLCPYAEMHAIVFFWIVAHCHHQAVLSFARREPWITYLTDEISHCLWLPNIVGSLDCFRNSRLRPNNLRNLDCMKWTGSVPTITRKNRWARSKLEI